MNISNYKVLITNLPVRQQCFTTKRTTWKKAEKEIDWLKTFNDNLFNGNENLTISRQDIFETQDVRQKIVKTIYWGYPRGMRGNHFVNILERINNIEHQLTQTNQRTTQNFNELKKIFNEIKGLGLSTYSKLLYFFQLTFDNNPCLILDQRLIDVFANKTYSDFQKLSSIRYYYNAENKYLEFIRLVNQVSEKLETKGENIEQFLFIFGNNLSNKIEN